MKRILASVVALALSASAVFAHEFTLGNLEIDHPASKATLPGQPVGGGFMTITNKGAADDRLVSISAPEVSDDVQLHEMAVENDVMTMRQLADGVALAAGETVELKPGGLHVMLIDLKAPMKEGDVVPITLTFDDGSSKQVDAKVVRPMAAGMAPMSDHKH